MGVRRIAIASFFCGVIALACVGATGHGESVQPRTAPSLEASRALVIAGGLDGAMWAAMRNGLLDAARDLNVDLEIATIAAGYSQRVRDEQINYLESAAALGYEAVLLVPSDPAALRIYLQPLTDAGIPIVTALRPLDERTPLALSDSVPAGEWLARRIIDRSTDLPTVGIVLGPDGDLALHDALRAHLTAIAPGARILPSVSGEDTAAIRRLVEEVRFTSPSSSVIVALGSDSVLAAWEVARFFPALRLYGSDADQPTIDLLERGEIEALVVPDTYTIGYRALEVLERLRRGERIERVVSVPALLLDRDLLQREQTRRAIQRVIR